VRWVVVGGGSAGCVVAGRLAEAGHTVTVIEAGAAAPPVRTSFLDTLAAPGAVFDGSYLRGRGLGGSGAVNGMVATPGDIAQYESWGWSDAAAALDRVRARLPLEPAVPGVVDRALLAAAPDAAVATLTARGGRRVTSADVYLSSAGATVVAGATAARIELVAGRASGVRLADGAVVEADAVALAAGVIGTPLLLRASGVAHPEIGRGLRNHPGLPVTLHLREPVDVHSLVTGALLRRGDVQVTAMNHLGPAAPGDAMLLLAVLSTSSVGSLALDGELRHELDAADGAGLIAGRALVEELLAAPPFTELVDRYTIDPPGGVHHATSTCRMGVVVDDDGRVDGLTNVHVVDAAAFPDLPRTNTYLPTLMLAERLAARLVAR
jgi:choline dehydrogenase/5-(hydroxymethyl)furfural/furfural oxidase